MLDYEETGIYTCDILCRSTARNQPGSYILCLAKPVIYLYPEKTTKVSVAVQTPGVIYKSIPFYPKEGWQDVIAQPDGDLMYQNKHYSELYYESAVSFTPAVSDGIIIPKSQLENSLSVIIAKLGLKPTERDEFLAYWMPKVSALSGKYILFSVIKPEEKEKVDRVDISPKPDTFIQFIAYFKPLDFPISIKPLNLPDSPPKRVGFTAVEWGGSMAAQ